MTGTDWCFAAFAAAVVLAMVGIAVWPVLPAIIGWAFIFDWWR